MDKNVIFLIALIAFIPMQASSVTTQENLNTALIQALEKNDQAAVDLLLSQGANPNHIVANKTALQVSIAHQSIHNTAQLLRYGASIKEFKKLLPTIDLTTLHFIRETYQRLPDPNYKKKQPMLKESEQYLAELKQHGFVKISGLLSPEQIKQLTTDFSRFVEEAHQRLQKKMPPGRPYEELYWKDKENIFVSNNPFKYSSELVKICCHQIIIETINGYLGKIGYIHKGEATHYLPGGSREKSVFNWHHDGAGKRVKLLILLSETGDDSRCTTYIAGSHIIVYPLSEYQKSMIDPTYCLDFIPAINIVKFTGKPGDIYLFDTNGIHSGNVAPKGRDAFFISYSSDMGHIRPYKIDETIFASCQLIDTNPFDVMLKIQNNVNHTFSKASNWTDTLTDPDVWLKDREILELSLS